MKSLRIRHSEQFLARLFYILCSKIASYRFAPKRRISSTCNMQFEKLVRILVIVDLKLPRTPKVGLRR